MTKFKSNTDFRIGDKVVCVKGNGKPEDSTLYLEEGKVYTVSAVTADDEDYYIGLKELKEYKGEWKAGRFEILGAAPLEDTPMTETEKAVYHLQSLLHINNATIVITAEGLEVLRAEQDESYNPEVWSLDELLKALDVIEPYND